MVDNGTDLIKGITLYIEDDNYKNSLYLGALWQNLRIPKTMRRQ